MCPGGGADFASAVTFDPAWIYGCNTGTSCNGGVHFDNRVACQPTVNLDACAPAPTCSSQPNASNIWFKFYPYSSTVTLSAFQNTSFVVGIQAFSGGPTCGSLTQIGCAIADGPSSGVNLTMTGLIVGQLYYYRVFGSSTPVSQRTGLYCFCGTTGIQDFILPTELTSFKGHTSGNTIELNWSISDDNIASFDVEKSTNGQQFTNIGNVVSINSASGFSFTYAIHEDRLFYFRLKLIKHTGASVYSPIVALKPSNFQTMMFLSGLPGSSLRVTLSDAANVIVSNSSGTVVHTYRLSSGSHNISTAQLTAGVYFIRNTSNRDVQKFIVVR